MKFVHYQSARVRSEDVKKEPETRKDGVFKKFLLTAPLLFAFACGDSQVAQPPITIIVPEQKPPTVIVQVNGKSDKDAGVVDAGVPDVGMPDVGVFDAGVPDVGVPDAGILDAGVPDAGVKFSLCGKTDETVIGKDVTISQGDGLILNDNYLLEYAGASTSGNAIFKIVDKATLSPLESLEISKDSDYSIKDAAANVLVVMAVCSINSGIDYGEKSVTVALDRQLDKYVAGAQPVECTGTTMAKNQIVYLDRGVIMGYAGSAPEGEVFRLFIAEQPGGMTYLGDTTIKKGSSGDIDLPPSGGQLTIRVELCDTPVTADTVVIKSSGIVLVPQDSHFAGAETKCDVAPLTVTCGPATPNLREASLVFRDDDAGKSYQEVMTKTQLPDGSIQYKIEFKSPFPNGQDGLPICTTPENGDYAACGGVGDYASANHNLTIEFMGEDYQLVGLNPDGNFVLGKVMSKAILDVGDKFCFPFDGIGCRLESVFVPSDGTVRAIITFEDKDGQVLKKEMFTQADPSSKPGIGYGVDNKTSTKISRIAPGYSFESIWVDMTQLWNTVELANSWGVTFNEYSLYGISDWNVSIDKTADGRVLSITMTAPDGTPFPVCK
ncbi:MAG: hypothetical protein V1492_00040 [Candidatus Micrarchaeota archaeon]